MAVESQSRDAFESPDLPMRPFVLGGVFLFAFVVVSMVGLWLIFLPGIPSRFQPPSQTQAGPRLQADPSIERDRVLAEQRKRLAEYQWIDRKQGLFAIPIDRAMAIVTARGADAYAPIVPAPAGQHPGAPQ